MFFIMFHKMQSKKSSSKDRNLIRERQKNKSNRKRKTNSVWLCLILPKCTGSGNWAHSDRVTSNRCQAHIRFSLSAKGNVVLMKSSLFRQISTKANVRNIAMHSFFKILLFSENYEFFNIWKFSQNLTFQKWNKIYA